jgi:hypothetical protein
MADLNTLRELCTKMQNLQIEKDTLEESLKTANLAIDDLRLKQIPEMMDQLEVKNATFQGIGRVQLAADLYCSTKAGKKDEAMQWLRDMEMDGMISETYNASSMKALVRRLMVDGTDIPECLDVTPFIRASIVKA